MGQRWESDEEGTLGRGNRLCKGPAVGGMQMVFS